MIYAIVAVIVLIADQWLKYWVTANITLDTGSQPLIDGVIKLVNTHNSGAAFGLLDNVPFARWLLLALAAALCVAVIILIVKRTFPGKFPTWCMALFVAGALGNCIDRSIYGYVVDMFKVEFVSFAVFNVADVFLTVSCLLFIIYLFVGGKDEDELEEKAPAVSKKTEKKPSEKKTAENKSAERKPATSVDYLGTDGTDEDVWNSFKAALHAAPNEAETAPLKPEPVAFPAAKAAPVKSVEAVKREKTPAERNIEELFGSMPDGNTVKLNEAPKKEISTADFTLEDILREFGS